MKRFDVIIDPDFEIALKEKEKREFELESIEENPELFYKKGVEMIEFNIEFHRIHNKEYNKYKEKEKV